MTIFKHLVPILICSLLLLVGTVTATARDAHVTFFDVGNATCVLAKTPSTTILVTDKAGNDSRCYHILEDQKSSLGPITLINLSKSQLASKTLKDSFEIDAIIDQTAANTSDNLVLEGETQLLVIPMADLPGGGTGFIAKLTYAHLNILFMSDNVSDNATDQDLPCKTLGRIYDPDTAYDLSADLVLAPASGRASGVSRCFLETIAPHFVVFSAGSGSALPSRSVMDLYESVGITGNNLLPTDRGDHEEGRPDQLTVEGCVDPVGDNTIKAILSSSGELTVDYINPPSVCEGLNDG